MTTEKKQDQKQDKESDDLKLDLQTLRDITPKDGGAVKGGGRGSYGCRVGGVD